MRLLLVILCWIFSVYTHADISFLTISDLHYGSDNKIGDGQDTNDQFLTITLEKFSQLTTNVNFILTLGDFSTHADILTANKELQLETVFHQLFQSDKTKKPMFYITGNNDSLQGNYQAFKWRESPLSFAKDWNNACVYCDGLLIDNTHLEDGGYYTSYVIPQNKNIILIALNTVQFAARPWYQPQYPNQEEEAQKQLAWLEEQLKTHTASQLLIAMHIPPGINYKGYSLWVDSFEQQFIQLLKNYQAQYGEITLLAAHNHRDEVRKIKTGVNKAIYAFSTPSISRVYHNYPGMKIFYLDRSFKLKNFTTFYTYEDTAWKNEHYQAIQAENGIFPGCKNLSLAECLDTQDTRSVCKAIEDGLFYGVKSPKVDNSVCNSNYPVN
jgi:UDP-2,3-diacylglucosamine pyrophosphatase LpxH